MTSDSQNNMTTRSQTELWLIGQVHSTLSLTKLPSKQEVLSLFYHYKLNEHKTIAEAAQLIAVDVLTVCAKARIPAREKHHVIQKIKDLFHEYAKLRKNKANKAKRSKGLIHKEQTWAVELQNLFDVAHARAMEIIAIEEDRDFLTAQREPGRKGYMANIDKVLAKKEDKAREAHEYWKKRKQREENERAAREETIVVTSSDASAEETEDDDEFGAVGGEPSGAKRFKTVRQCMTSDKFVASLDMAKVSDQNAALILTTAAQSLGHSVDNLSTSRSSIRRHRISTRQTIVQDIMSKF